MFANAGSWLQPHVYMQGKAQDYQYQTPYPLGPQSMVSTVQVPKVQQVSYAALPSGQTVSF
jgi:hypothetical protein